MSAYGPAVFVARTDGAEIADAEQQQIVKLVGAAAKKLNVTNDDGEAVSPSHYDYGEYEPKSVGVLLYSSYAYAEMPDEVREDEDAGWKELGATIAAEIERAHPGRYRFTCYAVED